MGTEHVTLTIRKAPLFGAIGLLLGVGAGFAVGRVTAGGGVSSSAVSPPAPTPPTAAVTVDTKNRPYRGTDNAPVTLVEFTDYECPFCKLHFQQTQDSLLAEYDGRIKYVVRNFPLGASHPRAHKAAEAAECAHDQGKFWKYHDLLFQRSPALGVDSLKAYAVQAGLNLALFTRCLDSGRKAPVVEKDVKDGVASGVNGTPTFFINGRILIGAQPLDAFRPYIENGMLMAGGAKQH